MDHVINFSPNQTLPPGYTVIWSESDEHYRWMLSEDVYGYEHCNRFRARRDAWAHYAANKSP